MDAPSEKSDVSNPDVAPELPQLERFGSRLDLPETTQVASEQLDGAASSRESQEPGPSRHVEEQTDVPGRSQQDENVNTLPSYFDSVKKQGKIRNTPPSPLQLVTNASDTDEDQPTSNEPVDSGATATPTVDNSTASTSQSNDISSENTLPTPMEQAQTDGYDGGENENSSVADKCKGKQKEVVTQETQQHQ